jgi:hypothetical protein
MHEHDLDLIAALADGSASDEPLALTLIETCPVRRAEYEAQTEVIAWLGSAPTPAMTDMERGELRRGVRAGIEPGSSRAAVTPWWQRLGYVAAGLLVVAGLVGVLQRGELMGGADEGAVSDVTTEAADGGEEAPTEDAPFVAEDAGEGSAAPTTTAAAAMDTLAAGETLSFAELADDARASQADREASATSDEDRECLARVGLDRHIVVREVEESGVTYLVVVPDHPTAEDVVIFVEIPACRIVHEDR